MAILIILIVGAVVGWLASMVVGGGGGFIFDMVIGIVGALIAGFLFGGATILNAPLNLMSFLYSLLGAIILLVIVNLVRRRRF